MYRYIILLGMILGVNCKNSSNESFNFTEEQIKALCLDSTKLIQAKVQTATTIDLNPFLKKQAFDFGTNVQDVRLIPLETTDASLVGNIYKVIASDSLTYIFDDSERGGIIIFDSNGKFIKRISHGRGPGELYHLLDIAYDKQNKQLLAYQHPFLLFYTREGNFIRQTRLPFGFYNFSVTPTGYVFKTFDKYGNEHLGDKMNNTLLVTDKNFKLKYAGLENFPKINYTGYNYLYDNNGKLRITERFNDTIYQYVSKTEELIAEYILDYHSKKVPESCLTSSQEFNKVCRQNDYYYFIGEYLETTFHQVFFLRNEYMGLQTVIFRDKRTGNLIGGTNADYDIHEIPAIAFPRAVSGADFISIHYPNPNDSLLLKSHIITETDKQKLKGLKEDDNPILVFYRLKTI